MGISHIEGIKPAHYSLAQSGADAIVREAAGGIFAKRLMPEGV